MTAAASNKKQEMSTNTLITVVAAVSLLVVVISFLVGKTLVAKFGLNNRVLAKKSVAAKQLKANLEAVPQLTENYEALGATAELIDRSLPTKPDFPALISMLETMAGTTGIRLLNIIETKSSGTSAQAKAPATGSAVTEPQPVPMQVTMEAGGNYTSLLSFLKTFELSARPMKITDVNLNGTTTAMKASIVVTTYHQAPADLSVKTEKVK